jgi:hypothetical protein
MGAGEKVEPASCSTSLITPVSTSDDPHYLIM